MRFLLFIIIALFSTQFINAQKDAKTILDKASTAYNNAGGISASFTLNTVDTKNKTTYSHDGTALMKGNKFKIDVPDGTTWFDGKTQWAYIKGSDEVNVSKPSGEELAAISPAVLLNIYKSGFKLNYKGEAKDKGKSVYVVELIPLKKADVSKFVIQVDKTTYLFTSISIQGKDGTNNNLLITKMKTGVVLADQTFVFNKKEYPKVEVIDLR